MDPDNNNDRGNFGSTDRVQRAERIRAILDQDSSPASADAVRASAPRTTVRQHGSQLPEMDPGQQATDIRYGHEQCVQTNDLEHQSGRVEPEKSSGSNRIPRAGAASPHYGFHADLSPDGKTLVHSTCKYKLIKKRGDGQEYDVHVYALAKTQMDGSGTEKLTTDTSYKNHPAWSPDGSRIAYMGNPGGMSVEPWPPAMIWTIWAKEQEEREYRPAGRRIQPEERTRGPDDLRFWELPGSNNSEPLHVFRAVGRAPVWSPDSQFLAFLALRTGQMD